MEEWVAWFNRQPPIVKKGGPTSGHHGHAGIPGKRGGSLPGKGAISPADVTEALRFVQRLTLTGGPGAVKELSPGALAFLKGTVTKKKYKLYRGIGLVKDRVAPADRPKVNALQPGDPVPEFLVKAYNPYSSYSSKKSVAKYYAQGRVSIVVEVTVPGGAVVADLSKLRSLLAGQQQSVFSDDDFDYFEKDKEIIVLEPITGGRIVSVSGKLPL